MKKTLFIATMILASNVAQAEMTLLEKIAADADRDPYAESSSSSYQVFEEEVLTEEYIAPEAAEQMKPSRNFKLENGNTVIKN